MTIVNSEVLAKGRLNSTYKPTVVVKQLQKSTKMVIFADGLDLTVNTIQFMDVLKKLTSTSPIQAPVVSVLSML